MTTPNMTNTFALDDDSARAPGALANRWNVSKSEALRRAIRAVAGQQNPSPNDALVALEQLQTSLATRGVDLAQWAQEVRAERHPADS